MAQENIPIAIVLALFVRVQEKNKNRKIQVAFPKGLVPMVKGRLGK